MADEENDAQGTMCEDEEDFGIDIDSNDEDDNEWDGDEEEDCVDILYDSPFDNVNEVLYLADSLQKL